MRAARRPERMIEVSEKTPESKNAVSTFFRPNPVLRRMSKIAERADGNVTATYAGIAVKTSFFLVVTLAGMLVYLLLNNSVFAKDAVLTTVHYGKNLQFDLGKTEAIALAGVAIAGLVSQLVGIFARKTIPVTGSIYSFSQGFVISFLVFKVLQGYEYLGLEALLLTAAVIGVMSWLYVTGRLRPTEKFNSILMTLVVGSILLALFDFIGSLIPALRPFIGAMRQNFGLCIALDVVGIVIASLFLISDFGEIDRCVKGGYPKNTEWYAAFGLTFTVIWLYMKILDLLMRVVSEKNSK